MWYFGKMFLASIHFVLALSLSSHYKTTFRCINKTQPYIPFIEISYVVVEKKERIKTWIYLIMPLNPETVQGILPKMRYDN